MCFRHDQVLVSVLKACVRLVHDDDCIYLINACVILHSIYLKNEDDNEYKVALDEEHDLDCEVEKISKNRYPRKRHFDATKLVLEQNRA